MNDLFFVQLKPWSKDCLILDQCFCEGCECIDVLIKDDFYFQVIESFSGVDFYSERSLYGLKPVSYLLLDGKVLNFFSRPSIKSIDNAHWCPLNKNVEHYFYTNSVTKNGFKFLSLESLFFYKICKIIFNNKCEGIGSDDLFFLNDIFPKIKYSNDVRALFESTFYKFTPVLYSLIEKKDYKSLYNEYLKFGEY